jgi:pimeloyl-ACP methyl ester carboxylesterase
VYEPVLAASGAIAFTWAGLVAAATLGQSRLIFGMPTVVRRAPLGPSAGAHEVIELSLTMPDGVVLRGWLARPRNGGGSRVAVYFGGRNEHVAWTPDLASWLGPDWALCAFSYRGRGGSTGRASESACVDDAVAQIRWAAQHALPVPVDNVALVGRSLGGAIAVLAAHRVSGEQRVAQQVLLSPPRERGGDGAPDPDSFAGLAPAEEPPGGHPHGTGSDSANAGAAGSRRYPRSEEGFSGLGGTPRRFDGGGRRGRDQPSKPAQNPRGHGARGRVPPSHRLRKRVTIDFDPRFREICIQACA